MLCEELRLLEQARANIDGIRAIAQVDINGNHALSACLGGGHAEGGGAGRAAADGGGGGEEERMDEGGEEEEEREEGAACHRHWHWLVPASCGCISEMCMSKGEKRVYVLRCVW